LQMTTWAVMAYSIALLGWSLVKVLAPGYFARQDTKTPFSTAMWAFGLNMALNLLAVIALKLTGNLQLAGMHITLALATAAGALLNAYLLYRGLRKQNVYQPSSGWAVLLIRIVLASAVMAIVLHFGAGKTELWATLTNVKRIGWISGLVIGGGVTYFVSLWLFGLRPAHFKH